MKGKSLKERGITLIALVITIIVLLILAGVTLSIVLHTGIIDNSQKAVDTYQAKAEDEVKQLDELTLKIQTQFGILDNTEGEKNKTITGSEEFTYNNPVIPVGFKTSNEGASWKSSDGETVDGWNSGLVIEDKDGNQFVWVPVDGKDVIYAKWLGNHNDKDITNAGLNALKAQPDALPNGIEDEEAQIGKYHGFYIARYEAGMPEDLVKKLNPEDAKEDMNEMQKLISVEGIPVSKKNQVPWNNITYTQAKVNAEKMYSNDNVQSCLITGTMWDTTLSWLEKSKALTSDQINQDSTSWGNYKDAEVPGITEYSKLAGTFLTGVNWEHGNRTKPSGTEKTADYIWLLKTGNTEYTKRNNIYDLAGNLWELTTEQFRTGTSSYRVSRGGCYNSSGDINPASCRDNYGEGYSPSHLGFRVGLILSSPEH